MQKHRLALAALAGMVAAVHVAGAQKKSEPPDVARHVAIGTIPAASFAPTTVEVTTDGWIVVSLYPSSPGAYPPPAASAQLAPVETRVILEPREVAAFSARARVALATYDSIGRDSIAKSRDQSITLGDGPHHVLFHLEQTRIELPKPAPPRQSNRITLQTVGCGSIQLSDGRTRQDLLDFLVLLDSAAARARRMRAEPKPPTLRRSYSAGEVSCMPQFSGPNRRLEVAGVAPGTEVAAEFIIDTAGVVETSSMRFLPSAQAAAVVAVQTEITRRRYTPADWDGTPVRATVQAIFTIGPELLPARGGPYVSYSMFGPPPARFLVEPDSTGYVRFEAILSDGKWIREWFAADSIDAAVRGGRRQLDSARATIDSTRPMPRFAGGTLGRYPGPEFSMSAWGRGKDLVLRGFFSGCAPQSMVDVTPLNDSMVVKFTEAAARARRMSNPTSSRSASVFSSYDVACPVALNWSVNSRTRFSRFQRYPAADYPTTHYAAGRFDVMFAMTVDSLGVANLNSLEFEVDTPSWIEAAVQKSVSSYRFRPAIRTGRPVAQRIIQVLRFEPMPRCEDAAAHPSCPRHYSDR